MKNALILASILTGAACSSPPPKENLPSRSEPMVDRRVKGDTIVALINGEPLMWQTVAEKVLELNLKESIDQYVRWKIVDDRRLARGISLVVFPQGARQQVFDSGQFNSIAVKLAQRAGVPLVPVALATDAWGVGRRLADFGRIDPSKTVRFAFGEPMWVRGRGTDEHQAIVEFIQGNLRNWGAAEQQGPRRPFSGRTKPTRQSCGEIR